MSDDAEMPTGEARKQFAQVVDRAYAKGERVRLTRNGRPIAALISMDDLELLEDLEDRADVLAAREAILEDASKPRVPFAELKAELSVD